MAKRICAALLAILLSLLTTYAEESAKPPITKETARQILDELRLLDGAIDTWAIEHNKPDNTIAAAWQIRQYIKPTHRLWKALGNPGGPTDILGNAFGPFIVPCGKVPLLHPDTVEAFAKVVPHDFWGYYASKQSEK